MHDYHASIKTSPSSTSNPSRSTRSEAQATRRDEDQNNEDDEMFPHPEGDAEGGYSYGPAVNVPLMTKHRMESEGDVVFDGDEELSKMQQDDNGNADQGNTELVPYAHRDLKPGYAEYGSTALGLEVHYIHFRNVMISDDGTPILMDFGSTMKARIPIENRSQAMLQQVSCQFVDFHTPLYRCYFILYRKLRPSRVRWLTVHLNSSM